MSEAHIEIVNADVLKWCEEYEGPQFSAIVADPPYHLTSERWKDGGASRKEPKSGPHARTSPAGGFMQMAWDGGTIAFRPATWEALSRHLLPGAFVFSFGGGRTYHRMVCAMEDAGLIVHDMSVFAHGQGLPKGVDISKAVDKKAGAKREVIEVRKQSGAKFKLTADLIDNGGFNDPERESYEITAPATEMAKVWNGWRYGQQAIKPAVEPIALVQKPYEGKPLDCIVRTGAGALNIELARIGTTGGETHRRKADSPIYGKYGPITEDVFHGGRWPSNFLLLCERGCEGDDHLPSCPVSELDRQSGYLPPCGTSGVYSNGWNRAPSAPRDAGGGASRFFFVSKPDVDQTEAGLDELPLQVVKVGPKGHKHNVLRDSPRGDPHPRRNTHPTKKSVDLCSQLARLLLPPDHYAPRRILIPFAGSGSECIAAALVGWEVVIGIEQSPEYCKIARARLAHWLAGKGLENTSPDRVKPATSKGKQTGLDLWGEE